MVTHSILSSLLILLELHFFCNYLNKTFVFIFQCLTFKVIRILIDWIIEMIGAKKVAAQILAFKIMNLMIQFKNKCICRFIWDKRIKNIVHLKKSDYIRQLQKKKKKKKKKLGKIFLQHIKINSIHNYISLFYDSP